MTDTDDLNVAELAELLGLDPGEQDADLVRARIRELFADARCAACGSFRVAVVSREGHGCIVIQCRRCSHLSGMLTSATPAQMREARTVERAVLVARYRRTGRVPSWAGWSPPPDRSYWPPSLQPVTV